MIKNLFSKSSANYFNDIETNIEELTKEVEQMMLTESERPD